MGSDVSTAMRRAVVERVQGRCECFRRSAAGSVGGVGAIEVD